MKPRILVAGVGNIFLGDDAFGSEVARALAAASVPDGVKVHDFGIAGIHLAYELLEGYETLVLVDALATGGEPGSLVLFEPSQEGGADTPPDAHGMDPRAVLDQYRALGGDPVRVLVVGCEPAVMEETIGLSPAVAGAVPEAVRLVLEIVDRELGTGGETRATIVETAQSRR